MNIKNGIVERIDPRKRVKSWDTTLTKNGSSIQAILREQAWKDAGIDPEEPGTVTQHYIEDDGLLVFDLRGDFDE